METEVVEGFETLGTLGTCHHDVLRERKSHKTAANKSFQRLRNQLRSRDLQT